MIEYIIGGVVIVGGFLSGIRLIEQTERGLIETWGKYTKYSNPGFHWIVPVMQSMRRINITEMMVNAEPQEIITQDKLNAKVDAQVYFKVKDDEENVKASQYNVYNYKSQIVNLARTTLRNIIGNMNLSDANSKRDSINKALLGTLVKETKNWGIEIVRTEIKEIEPPASVQETMNSVVMAENRKTAAIDLATARETEADGIKRAAIKSAEGTKQAKILEAEGIRQFKILEAEGQAKAFDLINKSFIGNAQILKQLDVTQASLENNSKIVVTEKGITPTIVISNEKVIPLKK